MNFIDSLTSFPFAYILLTYYSLSEAVSFLHS